MKKIFSIIIAFVMMITLANAQTVESSRLFENTYVTLVGGGTTTGQFNQVPAPFFWDGAKGVAQGVRPFAGLEFGKYVTEHNNVKCLGIKIDGYRWCEPINYFDHQQLTDGYTGDKCIVNIWYPKECVEFIFNKYVGLQTGCD